MVFIGDLCERDVESQVIGCWFGFSHFLNWKMRDLHLGL